MLPATRSIWPARAKFWKLGQSPRFALTTRKETPALHKNFFGATNSSQSIRRAEARRGPIAQADYSTKSPECPMRLYLHIGMQKTGTSALQYFFHYNRAELAKDGILYPHISEFDAINFSGVS